MQNLTVRFNHKPLRLSKSIVTSDSVPGRQTFDAAAGGHLPDYTLTPLTIQPLVGYTDPDGIIPSGTANSRLADILWEQFVYDSSKPDGGEWKAIGSTDPDFGLVLQSDPGYMGGSDPAFSPQGGDAGKLYVRRNADPGKPLMLRFSAKFIDPRTLQASRVAMDYTVICDNATSPQASVSLDCRAAVYNPLQDPDLQTVRATVNSPAGTPPVGSYLLVWEVMWDGAWECLNPSDPSKTVDPLLYFITVAPDGQSIDVDRSMAPEFTRIRCRLRHSYLAVPGDPAFDSLAPDSDRVPHAVCAIRRMIPKIDKEAVLATSIPTDARLIAAQGCLRLRSGAIVKENPGVLLPVWRTGTNSASGTAAMQVVSTEMSALLDTSVMHASHGMQVGFDVEDTGPLVPLTDADGSILTDDDGSIILFH